MQILFAFVELYFTLFSTCMLQAHLLILLCSIQICTVLASDVRSDSKVRHIFYHAVWFTLPMMACRKPVLPNLTVENILPFIHWCALP